MREYKELNDVEKVAFDGVVMYANLTRESLERESSLSKEAKKEATLELMDKTKTTLFNILRN